MLSEFNLYSGSRDPWTCALVQALANRRTQSRKLPVSSARIANGSSASSTGKQERLEANRNLDQTVQVRASELAEALEHQIELRSHIESVPLAQNVAMPGGLITNELVSNAFKYAFAGRASGSVADDGVGVSGSSSLSDVSGVGIGQQLVSALTTQLNGSVSTITENGITVIN